MSLSLQFFDCSLFAYSWRLIVSLEATAQGVSVEQALPHI